MLFYIHVLLTEDIHVLHSQINILVHDDDDHPHHATAAPHSQQCLPNCNKLCQSVTVLAATTRRLATPTTHVRCSFIIQPDHPSIPHTAVHNKIHILFAAFNFFFCEKVNQNCLKASQTIAAIENGLT